VQYQIRVEYMNRMLNRAQADDRKVKRLRISLPVYILVAKNEKLGRILS
jgi:hypothetical protein